MRFIYSKEQLEFLRKGFKKMRIPELTQAFNEKFDLDKTEAAIKTALSNRGFTCGRKGGNPQGTLLLFTIEQADFIKEGYKRLSIPELRAALNLKFSIDIKESQVKAFTHNHHILSGRTGCFEKGEKPWNTGTKGLVKPNSGNFKKGQVPINLKPLGTERINVYGYIEVKIDEPNPYVNGQMTRWKLKHIVMWEKEHGSVPDGHIVIFLDSNKQNCSLDNLIMITKKINVYLNRNGYGELTGDLKMSAIALAKVAQKTSQLKKEGATV